MMVIEGYFRRCSKWKCSTIHVQYSVTNTYWCVCFVSCSPSGQNLWTLSFVSQHGYRTLWPASNFTQGWQPVRMTPLTESPLTISCNIYIYIHEQMIFMDSAGPSLFYKLMAMIFPFACWLILVIIWLQQMYLYAAMFLDHTTSKTSGLHQCLWGSLCSFVGLSFCPSPGAWYADAKKDSCTVLKMQHVLKKVPWARWLLNSLYVWAKSKHDCYTVPVCNGSLDGNSAVYGIGPKVSLPKRRILQHKWTCSRHAIA